MLCCGGSRADEAQADQPYTHRGVISDQPMLQPQPIFPARSYQPTPGPNRQGSFEQPIRGYHNATGDSISPTMYTKDTSTYSLPASVPPSVSQFQPSTSRSRGYTTGGTSVAGTMSPGPGAGFNSHITLRVPPPTVEKRRMSVLIDFGSTFSGVAFASGTRVKQILQWPGTFEKFHKIPTCILYGRHSEILAWGLEAKAPSVPGSICCEWFKLFLEPKRLRDGTASASGDPRLPGLPPGKTPIDAIIDFLSCLWSYAQQRIRSEIGAVAELDTANVWLTVPAAWDAKGCGIMREAAIRAGLVQSVGTKGQNWRDRLRIITKLEAAAVHCAHLTTLHKLKPLQNFMICNAGGGTVDLGVYRILGSLERLEIGEVCARSGAACGSLFLDLRFRELVARILVRHPAHTDPSSLAYFQRAFSETYKPTFRGEEDDRTPFQFYCFNIEDLDDPAVGLSNGALTIPGALLRSEVFDPVIAEVLQLIEDQVARCKQPIHALLLTGSFSGSEYLFKRVSQRFGSRIPVLARPDDADTATCRGAARYVLANRELVWSVVAPRAYIMVANLPAEREDWIKRPTFISQNNAGAYICVNRLQYLVQKGAILHKGERVNKKFSKFAQGPQDSTFAGVLYTSDSEHVMRYTDEGEVTELCKWTVNLNTLPSFAERARMGSQSGFYTEFELGFEFDSAEVRGVLLYNGGEYGRVVFEFLN